MTRRPERGARAQRATRTKEGRRHSSSRRLTMRSISGLMTTALVVAGLGFAAPAHAASTGSITDNGTGSVTVTYSAVSGEDIILFICPSGTVTCDIVAASYKMGTGAAFTNGTLAASPATVAAGTNVVIGFGPNGGPLPGGSYVFSLYGDRGPNNGGLYQIPNAQTSATVTAGGGGGGGGGGGVTPSPVFPPSTPDAAQVQAGNGEVTVSWAAPASQGSFPVTTYQVQASPGGQGCLVPATTTMCRVGGLGNGINYTFRVRALNGGGWSPWADAGTVTPTPTPDPDASIMITGSRSANERVARVSGTSIGLAGASLQSMVRLSTQVEFTTGSMVQVGSSGDFTWKRRAAPHVSVEVYFTSGDITSNAVTISGTR